MSYINLQTYLGLGNVRVDNYGGLSWCGMLYYHPLINLYFTGSLLELRNSLLILEISFQQNIIIAQTCIFT